MQTVQLEWLARTGMLYHRFPELAGNLLFSALIFARGICVAHSGIFAKYLYHPDTFLKVERRARKNGIFHPDVNSKLANDNALRDFVLTDLSFAKFLLASSKAFEKSKFEKERRVQN